jgi:hypothetical protein
MIYDLMSIRCRRVVSFMGEFFDRERKESDVTVVYNVG